MHAHMSTCVRPRTCILAHAYDAFMQARPPAHTCMRVHRSLLMSVLIPILMSTHMSTHMCIYILVHCVRMAEERVRAGVNSEKLMCDEGWVEYLDLDHDFEPVPRNANHATACTAPHARHHMHGTTCTATYALHRTHCTACHWHEVISPIETKPRPSQ